MSHDSTTSTCEENTTARTIARRTAYTLAAGAAVGAAGQADAEVQYSGVQDLSIAQYGAQDLNLDGDAFNDILLKNYVFGGNYQGATVNGYPGKLVISNGSFPYYVSALEKGDLIDGTVVGPTFYGALGYAANPGSEFDSSTDAFIGLSFPIGGNAPEFIHYGWIRVDIDNSAGTFVIRDWAYNPVPNRGILAGDKVPEPGTLGLLAAGAAGVASMRRRRKAV
ncbi:PEP-CTERM motif protein [Pseudobythopirellula maris]|uniref:PEP-CTERM motif protein n=1 Tax=Pseudobythopirellula maris TaxID=2527991 RepID=A0A5C5ZHG1_9BACT|nr:PEP-CTERM sorting domain-containing protein [Pseudobythopirellula maris]TWT86646.1 PEP-CTERM motif protein [Pseudobythopirellula maris]